MAETVFYPPVQSVLIESIDQSAPPQTVTALVWDSHGGCFSLHAQTQHSYDREVHEDVSTEPPEPVFVVPSPKVDETLIRHVVTTLDPSVLGHFLVPQAVDQA